MNLGVVVRILNAELLYSVEKKLDIEVLFNFFFLKRVSWILGRD